jgi:hypothetical protein
MKNWLNAHWLKLVAVAMLLGALYPFPFAYYQLMNWIVVGASLITAQQANTRDRMFLVWLFIFIAVIFNPIAPFELRADVWQIADLIVAVTFIFALFIKPKTK